MKFTQLPKKSLIPYREQVVSILMNFFSKYIAMSFCLTKVKCFTKMIYIKLADMSAFGRLSARLRLPNELLLSNTESKYFCLIQRVNFFCLIQRVIFFVSYRE